MRCLLRVLASVILYQECEILSLILTSLCELHANIIESDVSLKITTSHEI